MVIQIQDSEQNEDAAPIAILDRTAEREQIFDEVSRLSPWLPENDASISDIRGGIEQAGIRLSKIEPARYGGTRNHVDGAVTGLSPYIRHGVTTLSAARDQALSISSAKSSEKFIQQLAWRDYWQRLYREKPEMIWNDAEDYKTGFTASDYADDLPQDIAIGQTGVAVIDHFLRQLIEQGYIHNHARLYLASYVCHWRRIKWQAGARFFLSHLLDGDPASNNLSWQWVASTFSHKPYYFNLDNVRKFTGPDVDTSASDNTPLVGSYEDIFKRLFPNLEYQGS